MKKMFLALLAVVAMVACEDKSTPQTPPNEPETEVATKYNLTFNSEGECYSQSFEGISEDVFTAEIKNYGWKQIDLHEIFDNGNIEVANFWEGRDGGGSYNFYINETVLTQYTSSSAYPPGEDKGYCNYDYAFEDSAIRIKDNTILMFRLLELDDDTMVCIEYIGTNALFTKNIYGLGTYKRMTPEELEKVQQTYTRNWDEAE
ncbi:MAG: hypothetical protein E7131_00170 [Rikenellaceae bacterium]|nr:hypothetical protein [Rikenellaceae bacterium]